jgi:hypothetical protein
VIPKKPIHKNFTIGMIGIGIKLALYSFQQGCTYIRNFSYFAAYVRGEGNGKDIIRLPTVRNICGRIDGGGVPLGAHSPNATGNSTIDTHEYTPASICIGVFTAIVEAKFY